MINDNVIPDRDGRGYVLRRILRRSSRFLYKQNIKEPFLFKCADNICNSSKDFPELKVNSSKIVETIKTEEIKYLKTLGKGIELIDDHLETKSQLDGQTVFKLYDTYGFPFEITEEIANEKNIKIDKAGYEKLMKDQKSNARSTKIFTDKSKISFETSYNTEFLGYDKNNLQSEVLDIYYNDEKVTSARKVGDEYLVILAETSMYPEGGGNIVILVVYHQKILI